MRCSEWAFAGIDSSQSHPPQTWRPPGWLKGRTEELWDVAGPPGLLWTSLGCLTGDCPPSAGFLSQCEVQLPSRASQNPCQPIQRFLLCFFLFVRFIGRHCLLSQVMIIPQNLCLLPIEQHIFCFWASDLWCQGWGTKVRVILCSNRSLNSSSAKWGDWLIGQRFPGDSKVHPWLSHYCGKGSADFLASFQV